MLKCTKVLPFYDVIPLFLSRMCAKCKLSLILGQLGYVVTARQLVSRWKCVWMIVCGFGHRQLSWYVNVAWRESVVM